MNRPVLGKVRSDEDRETSADVRFAGMLAHGRTRWQTYQPASAEARRTEAVVEQRGPGFGARRT